jgi:hypothetical protein
VFSTETPNNSFPKSKIANNKNKKGWTLFGYIKTNLYLCTRKQEHRGVEQLVARQAHNLEVIRSSRVSATFPVISLRKLITGFFFYVCRIKIILTKIQKRQY